MLEIGLALMAIGPLFVVFTLARLPRLMHRQIGVLEFVYPTAAGVCLMFVGAGVAELGLQPSGQFIGPALVKFVVGLGGFALLGIMLLRARTS